MPQHTPSERRKNQAKTKRKAGESKADCVRRKTAANIREGMGAAQARAAAERQCK